MRGVPGGEGEDSEGGSGEAVGDCCRYADDR